MRAEYINGLRAKSGRNPGFTVQVQYHCFSLSLRDVELILAARGIMVSYESIREWGQCFGRLFANALKQRRSRPGDKWHADEVFVRIPWLLRLDGLDQAPKRRVARLVELPPEAEALIGHFVDQRLLVRQAHGPGETTVEVSHEAVLRHWPLLARWIAEERENLVRADAIIRATADWERERTDTLLLHRGERLAAAERLLARPDLPVSSAPMAPPTSPPAGTGNAPNSTGSSVSSTARSGCNVGSASPSPRPSC